MPRVSVGRQWMRAVGIPDSAVNHAGGAMSGRAGWYQIATAALVVAAMAVASPMTASAQFGGLKKLIGNKKPKLDTAAVVDSAAATAAPAATAAVAPANATATAATTKDSAAAAVDTTKGKHHSFLGKALSAANKANDKIEQKTGISAKSVALNVATGGAAAALQAKGAVGQGAAAGLTGATNAGAAVKNGVTGAATGGVAGLLGKAVGSKIPNPMAGAASKMAHVPTAAGAMPQMMNPQMMQGMSGVGNQAALMAQQQELLAFQQEMMQVGQQASAGDAAAAARLQAWNTITMKYQPQIQALTIKASGGDMSAAQALNNLQMQMIHEWRSGGKPHTP